MKKILTLLCLAWQFSGLQAQCEFPLEDATFSQIHAGVAGMNSGQDATMRDITANNCLTGSQVGLFAQLYANDNDRYNYMIFAKPYVSNPDQYAGLSNLLNDANLRQQFLNAVNPPAPNPTINPNPNLISPNPIVVNPNPNPNTNPNVVINPNPVVQPPQPQPLVVYVDGYTGRLGCQMPVNDATVNAWLKEMESGFDKDHLDLFKRKVGGQCLTVEQISRISKTFSFDSYKLDFLKTALAHTYDLDNYMTLGSEFSFSSSKKDLSDFYNKNVGNYVWKENYVTKQAGTAAVQGYSGRTGCAAPMSNSEFDLLLKAAQKQSFDNQRTEDIKNILGGRCMSVAQAKKLGETYSFDNYKVEFAKFAYKHTYDLDNFLELESLFSFDSYKRQLREIAK